MIRDDDLCLAYLFVVGLCYMVKGWCSLTTELVLDTLDTLESILLVSLERLVTRL